MKMPVKKKKNLKTIFNQTYQNLKITVSDFFHRIF